MKTERSIIIEARLVLRIQKRSPAIQDAERQAYLDGVAAALKWVCNMPESDRPSLPLDRRSYAGNNRIEDRREETDTETILLSGA